MSSEAVGEPTCAQARSAVAADAIVGVRWDRAIRELEASMTTLRRHLQLFLLCVAQSSAPAFAGQGATPLGPTPYLSAADSPFPLGTGSFCLEDFEGAGFDVPGVSGNGSVIGASGITDSIDGDDGTIDGFGTGGQSYFSGDGPGGITFTFDPQAPLGLPTNAGMVWTDGGLGVDVTFESFDQNGASLGTIVATAVADGDNSGGTAEDRFFGIMNPAGISAIKLSSPGGGIEVDHLQFDNCSAAPNTTTTTTLSGSTTTTLPTNCAGVPSGPGFASLNCRIAALQDAVEAATELGDAQSKLAKALGVAKSRKEDGEAKCAGGDAKRARKRLQQTARKLTQFSHRLRSNASRKKIPPGVREPLAAEADRIRDDAKSLRRMLDCGG
jgi:hypothetical protein